MSFCRLIIFCHCEFVWWLYLPCERSGARGFLRGSSVSPSGTGPDKGFSGSGSRGGTGIVSGGEGGMESVVCRARGGAVDSQVPAPRSSVKHYFRLV